MRQLADTPAGQALANAGFPVVDGQVEISPLEVNVPGNATVGYDGGEVVNLGGNGTVTVGVSGGGTDGPCCNEGPPTPWSVSLVASASDVAVGSAVTLTATADQNVAGSPYYINLVDQASGAVEASCGSGSTCAASVSEGAAGTQTFYADVGAYQAGSGTARSSTVSVTWYAMTITATFSPGTVQQGRVTTLQATTSGPVRGVTATLPWNGQAVALSGGGSSWAASIGRPASRRPTSPSGATRSQWRPRGHTAAMILGTKRKSGMHDPDVERALLRFAGQGELAPVLAPRPEGEPAVEVPSGGPVKLFAGGVIDPEALLADLPASRLWARARELTGAVRSRQAGRPPVLLHRGHLALLLAAGEIDGALGSGQSRHVVRGTVRKHVEVTEEEDEEGNLVRREVESLRILVRTIALDGVIRTLE